MTEEPSKREFMSTIILHGLASRSSHEFDPVYNARKAVEAADEIIRLTSPKKEEGEPT